MAFKNRGQQGGTYRQNDQNRVVIRWKEKEQNGGREVVKGGKCLVYGGLLPFQVWIYSARVIDCKSRRGNKVMSMRSENKLIWSQHVTLKTGLPSINMIKGLLHSNTNPTAIDLNASLSQPLTIYDNYYYAVMRMVMIYHSCAVHNEKITLANLLHWRV